MRYIVTDTGNVWNLENKHLKIHKRNILVIRFLEYDIPREYECFNVPLELEERKVPDNKERLDLGNPWFRRLASVAQELNSLLEQDRDVVFLTDNEPTTLYPYPALKDIDMGRNNHLVAFTRWGGIVACAGNQEYS